MDTNDKYIQDFFGDIFNQDVSYTPKERTIDDMKEDLNYYWQEYMDCVDEVKKKGYKVYRNSDGRHIITNVN